MTRVSLKEAYDNKDVVAQIYAIRDIAEGAEDTANGAVSTANTASEHVDALVPQVEGAVQNANNASASAQASAQTVTGYENRLSDVEVKITTTEGQIVTIQGRVTALETADAQNVKINSINDYAVGLTGNQDNITGIKTFISGILNITSGNPELRFYDDRNKSNLIAGVGVRYKTGTSTNASLKSYAPKINPTNNDEIQRGGFLQLVSNQDGTMTLSVFGTKADGSLSSKAIASFNGETWVTT